MLTEKRTPQGHKKTLWLIPILLAAALAVGYLALGSSGVFSASLPTSTPQEQKSGTTQSIAPETVREKTQPTVDTSDNEKSIIIKVTKDGFNGKPDLRITLKKDDKVKVTYLYADENGDEHQLFISGYDVFTPRFSLQDKEVSVRFTATETGTFALFCLNQNCKAHDNLNGKITVIS